MMKFLKISRIVDLHISDQFHYILLDFDFTYLKDECFNDMFVLFVNDF